MKAPNDRRALLRRRAKRWACRLKVAPRIVRVGHMTRKWGSCSTLGTVTLAADLAHQAPGFQDFVIVHELLHLRLPNHGKLFKATMTAYVPDWKRYDIEKNNRRSNRTCVSDRFE